jgi:hypothetical protein
VKEEGLAHWGGGGVGGVDVGPKTKQTNTVARKIFNAKFPFNIYVNWGLYGGDRN